VIETLADDRLITTAAHCLPYLPEPHPADTDSRLYQNLLGPIGGKLTVWAECIFVNPVADLAVLGSPDNQSLIEEAEAYEAFVESVTPFSIGDAPEHGPVWLFSLEGEWFSCQARYLSWVNSLIGLTTDTQNIEAGMSGLPIVSETGEAVGVVSIGSNGNQHGPNPRLVRDLPGWLSYPQQRQTAEAREAQVKAFRPTILKDNED
jgi:hypothetical protein